jgi:hypothetical protein
MTFPVWQLMVLPVFMSIYFGLLGAAVYKILCLSVGMAIFLVVCSCWIYQNYVAGPKSPLSKVQADAVNVCIIGTV